MTHAPLEVSAIEARRGRVRDWRAEGASVAEMCRRFARVGVTVSGKTIRRDLEHLGTPARPDASVRQARVAQLRAQGLSTRAIAERLQLEGITVTGITIWRDVRREAARG